MTLVYFMYNNHQGENADLDKQLLIRLYDREIKLMDEKKELMDEKRRQLGIVCSSGSSSGVVIKMLISFCDHVCVHRVSIHWQ